MLHDDFLVETEKGYYCRYGNFYLDAKQAVVINVVSHAHADHACPGSHLVYCTQSTSEFMQIRYKKRAAHEFKIVEFNQSLKIGEVEIEFFPAGHMLGSAQILMVYQGIRYLYSGDIKLQIDSSCERAVIPKADVLITECTFATPGLVHPDPVHELSNLLALGTPLLIGCYVLGKTQRIHNLLHQISPELHVQHHYDAIPFGQVYQRHGFLQGSLQALDKKQLKKGVPGVYLVSPLAYYSYKNYLPYRFAFASGWQNLQNQGHSLLISDHIDWFDILKYIEEARPTEIWTIHGEGKHLVSEFSSSPVKVREIYVEGRN